MNIKRIFNGSLLLAIMTCTLLGLYSCSQNKVSGSNATVSAESLKIDKADSVSIIISKDGKTKARLRTKEFLQNDGAKPPFLDMKKGLFVEFFNDSMVVESTLKADKARFYPQKSNILVKDNVQVVTRGGDTLKTTELVWNNQLQMFYSDVPVQIIRGTSVSQGTGLEANKDLTWIRIYNQRGIVPVDKDQMPD